MQITPPANRYATSFKRLAPFSPASIEQLPPKFSKGEWSASQPLARSQPEWHEGSLAKSLINLLLETTGMTVIITASGTAGYLLPRISRITQ